MFKKIETQMMYVKSMKPECHSDELEIILVLSGTIQLYKIERHVELKKGEFAFVNRHITHYIESDGAYILSCKIKLKYFKNIFNRIEYVEFLGINELNEFQRPLSTRLNAILVDLLIKEYQVELNQESDDILDEEIVRTLFNSYQLIDNIKNDKDFINEELQDRYYFIVEYVFNHIDQKIVSDDIIKLLYMNSTYFSQFVKRIGGVGFKELVLYRKLIFMTCYLLNPVYSMDEIASKVGITDMKSFYTVFKKHFKESPSKWRHRVLEIENNYEIVEDRQILDTFIQENKISKHTDNTIIKLYKYLLVSLRETKNFHQTEFILNPYLDMGETVNDDYQIYKCFDSLHKVIKDNNLKLCLIYPYRFIKEESQYNLALEFLKLSISKNSFNEVKKWKIVIMVRNILDVDKAEVIRKNIIKEIGITNVEVQLDALQ